ncbi:hypothetical protein [Streptomyces sp. Iso 434]|uniref:hypothetical protein n=1 Tax=Streptomyces sp. Iso 434 TaxID=3062272 RepID=UPI0039817F1D
MKGTPLRRRTSLLTVAVAAAVSIPLTAGPAAAYDVASRCELASAVGGAGQPTKGHGIGSWNWGSRTSLTSVHLEAKDSLADSAHPAVRLVTKSPGGATTTYAWRHNTKGANTTQGWDTSASNSAGIQTAWVEGAIFDGSTLKFTCKGTVRWNPNY